MAAFVTGSNPGTAGGLVAFTGTSPGHLLVIIGSQTAATTAASATAAGMVWTSFPTVSTWAVGNVNSTFCCYGVSPGGNVTASLAPGAGGSLVNNASIFEISNALPIIDSSASKAYGADSATSCVSAPLTTTQRGSIVLAAVGMNGASGTITAWTGTGPMTNLATTTSMSIGGYYIPGSTLSAVTFTANWTTARNQGMLVVAFQTGSSGAFLPLLAKRTVKRAKTFILSHPRPELLLPPKKRLILPTLVAA